MAKQAGGVGAGPVRRDRRAGHRGRQPEHARRASTSFPLTVDYQEKTFAAGKIPGGFFKREGRPAEKEMLTSRLIDRPIRPLFPDGFVCETQIIATVLSFDKENDADMLAMIGASAALHVSDIPFHGPIAGVRVGRIDGKLVVNPTCRRLAESDLDLVVAGTRDGIVMVEGGAKMLSEDVMLDALFTAHRRDAAAPRPAGRAAREASASRSATVVAPRSTTRAARSASRRSPCRASRQALDVRRQARAPRRGLDGAQAKRWPRRWQPSSRIRRATITRRSSRTSKAAPCAQMIVKQKRRARRPRRSTDVRPITLRGRACCRARTARRSSPAARRRRWSSTTLGTSSDEQRIDALIGEHYKKFMLHYNFPPFSVGEVKFLRGPGRREIGHGALAERALSRGAAGRDRRSPTRSASSPRSSSRTARRRWPRSAAARCR